MFVENVLYFIFFVGLVCMFVKDSSEDATGRRGV